jgi:major membrane immunogen (membrane-anchored lipoprotein)
MPNYIPMKKSYIQCKQSKILVLLLIIPFLALSSCDTCNCTEDSLDEIKAFKPDNKYFKSSLVALHFMMETSPVAEADTFFQQLIQMHKLPVSAEGAKDGSYIGSTPYDAFDYRHEVKIKILNGEIVEVDYNEVKKDGKGKQEDEEYCEEMSVTGTTPAIAYPYMEEMLLTTQNMMEVDAVSGASYSLQRFRLAMTIALMKAII